MATTTNYSWTTPDDTALVKDGAAAIRSLGTAIDTTVFNNASAAIAKTIVDAKGDIIAATAADTVARLAVGSNDQVLTVDSSTATGLKWATPAGGGGKVLQVVQAITSTQTNIASTTYTDTNLTATITPTSATSKILVFANSSGRLYRLQNEIQGFFQIVRNSTAVRVFEYALTFEGSSNPTGPGTITALTYLDSPATTSATTYKVQAKVNTTSNSGQYQAQYGVSDSASVITLLEIGA